jgi:hypothetical protein
VTKWSDGIRRIEAPGIRSLQWRGDDLVDWVDGGRVVRLDGTTKNRGVLYAFRFDAAVTSPCGEWAVIYERLGTKGLVLENGHLVREIDRSYYWANAYEYPVAVFHARSGQIMLAHCPESYGRIDLEDIRSGARVAALKERKFTDRFHSRLRVSPDGRWLSSAGWTWHPWGTMWVFDIDAALGDATMLDQSVLTPDIEGEVAAGEFLPDGRIVISTSAETLNGEDGEKGAIGPNALTLYDPNTGEVVSSITIPEVVGTLMPVDSGTAVGFYGHPKLFSLKTGEVLRRWEGIDSGKQTSSILADNTVIPPIALDPLNRRFAVADASGVSVVTIGDGN